MRQKDDGSKFFAGFTPNSEKRRSMSEPQNIFHVQSTEAKTGSDSFPMPMSQADASAIHAGCDRPDIQPSRGLAIARTTTPIGSFASTSGWS